MVVTLDMEEADGSVYRHPRGYLYVISVAYDTEQERLVVELGCRLSLAYLTDKADSILPLVPVPLDPAQRTVQNCSASFAAAGMVLYQNNQGQLVSRKFFGNDSSAGIEAGSWVSVLGESALSVSPLAGTGAIPDEIDLSYQVPEGLLSDDNQGKVDITTETSNYFLNYPATVWTRVPDPRPTGTIRIPSIVRPSTPSPSSTTSCGQAPSPPKPGGTTVSPGGVQNFYLCTDLWTTERTNVYLPAVRVATSETHYNGPAAQTSLVEQTTVGPQLEANPGYFSDKYGFCVAIYGNACNPGGSCQYYGLDEVTLSKQITYYEYGGDANELVRTIQDTYQTRLSAYTPEEWRSGVSNGVPQDFNNNLANDTALSFFPRNHRYYQQNNSNVQLTTTYTSVTSRGVGPTSMSIDALNGIVTSVRRESEPHDPQYCPGYGKYTYTATDEKLTTILLNTSSYTSPPAEAGKYVLEESVPVPLLSEDVNQIEDWVSDYSEYLKRFVKGDIYGLQIAESMRPEIVADWYPGAPFRYADTANNKIMAMRMDACSWGVTQDEAIVVMNGIWNGFSSGTLVIGSNLVGNSLPDMTPGFGAGIDAIGGNPNGGQNPPQPSPIPPAPPSSPPEIDNDVVGESFSFIVEVNMYLDTSMFSYFPDGCAPKPH